MFRPASFALADEAELAGAADREFLALVPHARASQIQESIQGSARVFRWVSKSWAARIATARELDTPSNRLRPKNPLDSKPTSV